MAAATPPPVQGAGRGEEEVVTAILYFLYLSCNGLVDALQRTEQLAERAD